MLVWHLLSIQLAVSYGDLMCIYQKYPKCYILSLRRKDNDYCTAAPETIKCMKEDAAKCQSEEPSVIADLETVIHDVCERETQLNREYMKHKSCIFNYAMKHVQPCDAEFFGVLDNIKNTRDEVKDTLNLLNATCRYTDEVFECTTGAIGKRCGEEAKDFYNKLHFNGHEFMQLACSQNSVDSICISWISLMLQVVLLTSKFSESLFFRKT